MKILTTDYVRPRTACIITMLHRSFIPRLEPTAVRQFRVCGQLFLHRGDLQAYQPAHTVQRARKLARLLARAPKAMPTRRPEKGTRIDPSLYVTVGTAAGMAEVSRALIGLECRNGRIPAVKIDGQWLVLRSAAANRARVNTGRPRIHPLPSIRDDSQPVSRGRAAAKKGRSAATKPTRRARD